MFERFTDGARRAMLNAQEEARSKLASRIEPEHLLSAIAADPKADGAVLLSRFSMAPAEPSVELATSSPTEIRGLAPHIRLAEETKRVLHNALVESEALGSPHVTTAHVLAGLLASGPSQARQTLSAAGMELDALRATVRTTLSKERWVPLAPPIPRRPYR
jgi:ATP-dependent Clp protease ATP-binding subunit ClpA